MPSVAVNPREPLLGKVNAILSGRNTRHFVRDYPGPLSIKTIVNGTGVWETREGRFPIGRDSYLVLNRKQPYSLTIDSIEPSETFCIFFRHGFVEDAWRARTASDIAMLDDPHMDVAPLGFFERQRAKNGSLAAILAQLRRDAIGTLRNEERLEEGFVAIANALIEQRTELARELGRVPAVKSATRTELYSRLTRARSVIEATLDQPVDLSRISAAANLSAFHLHRAFTEAFGETPHRYVTRRRIERASRLLAETDMPVTSICLESGFQSLGSFSALFHRRTGMSPVDYRRCTPRRIC